MKIKYTVEWGMLTYKWTPDEIEDVQRLGGCTTEVVLAVSVTTCFTVFSQKTPCLRSFGPKDDLSRAFPELET